MSNLKRYDLEDIDEKWSSHKEMVEWKDGDWVKFEDIKHLLPTATNRNYAAETPKPCDHTKVCGCGRVISPSYYCNICDNDE